jgi:nickel-dependent lactate racemase
MLYTDCRDQRNGLTSEDIRKHLCAFLDRLGKKNKVLVIPPDYTRFHSCAGTITALLWEYFGDVLTDILPALGTHNPMSERQIAAMFPGIPQQLFRVHDWRNDVTRLGIVPSEFIRDISEGKLSFDWPAEVNRLLVEGNFDLILSVGQIVPHEVIGMANYTKNIFVGTGGSEGINKSHFLGAVHGIENILGKADNPVRALMNHASEQFLADFPIFYIHTVMGHDQQGEYQVKGLFIGDDDSCFYRAAELALDENVTFVEKPLDKVVVYLDPEEYRSTWLGNKSIYRTRMAIADGGELIVLAPGLREFGEDRENDRIIRKYGYRSTEEILRLAETEDDLQENLGAAAHLIHGSPEGRFTVTYCPGHLSRDEIESVRFEYGELESMRKRYDPSSLEPGFNTLDDGETVYYIDNPALGLWTDKLV